MERPGTRPSEHEAGAVLVLLDGLARPQSRHDVPHVQAPFEHAIAGVSAEEPVQSHVPYDRAIRLDDPGCNSVPTFEMLLKEVDQRPDTALRS